jgi:hypothetical protein
MRSRVCRLTPSAPESALDTEAMDTPAHSASSWSVLGLFLGIGFFDFIPRCGRKKAKNGIISHRNSLTINMRDFRAVPFCARIYQNNLPAAKKDVDAMSKIP